MGKNTFLGNMLQRSSEAWVNRQAKHNVRQRIATIDENKGSFPIRLYRGLCPANFVELSGAPNSPIALYHEGFGYYARINDTLSALLHI